MEIISVRIVSVDFYLASPVKGLDYCFSNFRSSVINQVPVIRIFGSIKDGTKICLHVHSVLPYFYIPYDDSIDPTKHDSFVYQMVSSLDKALNIMMGQQGSKDVHHVYDVTHVKGFPFYGYHPKEHQFLKISFYNPMLTKKAASLFQNAAICGKVYQTYESHLPYVLQFFIDYNLYGMSFVDVKTENVVFRGSEGLKRTSRCELEADTLSVHILNYLSYGKDSETHQNPGIAFLWKDETSRRRQLGLDVDGVLPAVSQDRPERPVAESELFYMASLQAKLENLNVSLNSTMATQKPTKKHKFNLTNMLNNSVYPALCTNTESQTLLNASCLPGSIPRTKVSGSASLGSKSLLNETIVDEDIVHNLTQRSVNDTFPVDDEDLSMLHLLENLEANENHIENDSLLAPMSQKIVSSPTDMNQSQVLHNINDSDQDNDSEEEDLDAVNITMEMHCSQSVSPIAFKDDKESDPREDDIPQLDGGNDTPGCYSAVKNVRNFELRSAKSSTKSKRVYAPLEIVIKSSPKRKFKREEHLNTKLVRRNLEREMGEYKNKSRIGKADFSTKIDLSKFGVQNCSVVLEKLPDCLDKTNDHHKVKLSSSQIVLAYDRERKFSPVPGNSKDKDPIIESDLDSSFINPKDEEQVLSFYDKTMVISSSPSDHESTCTLIETETTTTGQTPSVFRITPMISPPNPKIDINLYGIEEFEFTPPFFSDPADCDRRKEIGGVMLEIKDRDHCRQFRGGSIVDLEAINKTIKRNAPSYIRPFKDPPSSRDSEMWLKARTVVKNAKKQEDKNLEENFLPEIRVLEFKEDLTGLTNKSDDSYQNFQNNTLKTTNKVNLALNTSILEDIEDVGIKLTSSSDESMVVTKLLQSSKYKQNLNLTASCVMEESQLADPSLESTHRFKLDLQNLNNVKVESDCNNLVIFALEVHVQTRGNLLPDPEKDEVTALFYAIYNDSPPTPSKPDTVAGSIVGVENSKNFLQQSGTYYVENEKALLNKLVELIYFWDPDILVGYEIEMQSWGFLIQRGQSLGVNLASLLSRIVIKPKEVDVKDDDDIEVEYRTQLKIHGRIVMDLWRLLRHEVNLMSYTFENTMYHILHRRYPKHSSLNLTRMWADPLTRWIVLQYYSIRVRGVLELLHQLDLVGRTSEMAKLFGIQFFEVLSRGSQFRVESMMLRMAKPRNFIAISPSVQQRAHMRAPEYLPLILEPQSRFYIDPVIVLDFQSLYPSMMMAYNYCYSTCLGRVEHLGDSTPFEFGASLLNISPKVIRNLLKHDLITISPCGVAFVKPSVREGTVPRMVREILDTRIMVKASMKTHKSNKTLQRVLHSRQLGLKLIANVTYGYTAANFSGRMPCVEVADSIVAKGRETLEKAINYVESNAKWNVKVVYGDTDSLFVLVPGRNREKAFEIGEEIVKEVTANNPHPVKLKLEKVYQPCILQTKKRYVGYMYETRDQERPVYEAKGIETVRRDGCPLVAKTLEKVLRILFETKDVSLVKSYICNQFTRLIGGQINVQDLTYAKEFRGVNGYKPTACVPALELTRRWQTSDIRKVPRQGERVPYVIVNGSPGLPLIRLVRSPTELLEDEGLRINSFYYISKAIIPPLNRCLLLIGVDVNKWLISLRRDLLIRTEEPMFAAEGNLDKKKSTISAYFSTTDCLVDCGVQTKHTICDNCRRNPQKCAFLISEKARLIESKYLLVQKICQDCCGRNNETDCTSLDCPVLYVINKRNRKYRQLDFLYESLNQL